MLLDGVDHRPQAAVLRHGVPVVVALVRQDHDQRARVSRHDSVARVRDHVGHQRRDPDGVVNDAEFLLLPISPISITMQQRG